MIEFDVTNNWKELLKDTLETDKIKKLFIAIDKEYEKFEVYPRKGNIFNAFKAVPPEKVKIVILGQDPYPSPDKNENSHAHGFAFSSNSPMEIPKSLNNIFKELKNEYGDDFAIPQNGNLSSWCSQGVFLLNTVLTVRKGVSNSHKGVGWELLTNKAIEYLGNNENPIVFMLWGSQAQEHAKVIKGKNKLILTSSHPSPLSAYRSFFGNNHFKQANEFLIKNNIKPISW